MDQEPTIIKPIIDVTLEDLLHFKDAPMVVVLYGFPYDEGTKRNKGRPGGEGAYAKILAELYASHIDVPYPLLHLGAVPDHLSLEEAHEHLYRHVGETFNLLPQAKLLVLGGSNDQSYQNYRGYIDGLQLKKVGVINIDAHLDVRPLVEGKAHSGSPFRQMLEDRQRFRESEFVEFAIKGCSSSYDHYNFVLEHKGQVIYLERDIRRTKTEVGQTQGGKRFQEVLQKWEVDSSIERVFVSFDVDSIDSAWLPGVSAPSVIGGLKVPEALEIMKQSGRSRKVQLVDMSEFNPAVECERSVRLIGQMIVQYLQGVSENVN